MCSIIGSFKKDTLVDLCKLNKYRGAHSHSISYYNIVTGGISVQRGMGEVNYNSIVETPLVYMIVHMQAPTGEKSNIHPAHFDGRFLWHNGILKQSYIEQLREKLDEVCTWDTFLMLKSFVKDRESLDEFDGSLSCLLYDHEKLYLFRNEISPMFYDEKLNISSVMFNNSRSTPPNQLHHVDFNFSCLFAVKSFMTRFNPYFLQD